MRCPLAGKYWVITWTVLLFSSVPAGAQETPAPGSPPADAPVPASQPTSAPSSAGDQQRQPESALASPYEGLDYTGTPVSPPSEDRLPPGKTLKGSRQLPVYNGGQEKDLSAGEGLIWIPRVIFYPVHLVLDYGLRWPIVKLVTVAEERHIFSRVKRLLSFGEGDKGVLFPTAFFDFGLNPSLGFFLGYDDIGVKDHNLVVQAGFWHTGWVNLTMRDSFKVFRDGSGTVESRAELIYRPDFIYAGLGPDAVSDERFFRLRQVEVGTGLRAALQGLNRITFGATFRNLKITNGQEPGVESAGSPFLPRESIPGFGSTFNLVAATLKIELDSRNPERVFTPGSGVRFEAFTSFSLDLGDPQRNFLRWGGEATGFWDVSGINHVLALNLYVEILENTGGLQLPVTELVQVGGAEQMRGFREGHFHGESALALTASYRYPIWSFLDADIFAGLGNVFLGRFAGIQVERMVLSWGVGLRSNTSRDASFDLMVGFGSNQLQHWDNFELASVRMLFGINQGF